MLQLFILLEFLLLLTFLGGGVLKDRLCDADDAVIGGYIKNY